MKADFAAIHGEARDDLERLLDVTGPAIDTYGIDEAAVHLASGMLVKPEWDRVMLASVLGAALVRIEQLGGWRREA